MTVPKKVIINPELSYRIFISHKVSEHGYAVRKFKKILNRDGALKKWLKIYVSTEVAPGEDWAKKLHEELDEADMLLYIYCYNTPPRDNDWCNYETGYFAKKSNRSNIITIVPMGVKPPSPFQSYQFVELTNDGIKQLLKKIYVDTEIWEDVFNNDNKKALDEIIDKIQEVFSPTQKPVSLSPRIWITIKSDFVEKFKSRSINLPLESLITGETEAAKKFGYESSAKEEITLKRLIDIAEYRGTLPVFFEVLSDTMQDILNKKPGPWKVPPVKVLNDSPPNILVPAYLEKMPNGDRKFEFIITAPPKNFNYPRENSYAMDLYNLFIVAWHFRWRIIEKYLPEFKRIATGDLTVLHNRAKELIEDIRVDFNAVVLDSYNRKLQYPDDIIRNFEGEDKILMKKIVDKREGLWSQIYPIFTEACENVDVGTLVDCLNKFKAINKTTIIACLRLLDKVSGSIIEGNTLEEVDLNNVK
jgi:hypothetical protein